MADESARFNATFINNWKDWDIPSMCAMAAKKQLTSSGAKQWKPHKYQQTAMKFQLEHAAAGLLLDPGMGKTSITLGSITELQSAGMFHRALVIAPRRVCHEVWPVEVEDWAQFNHLRVAVMHGSVKKREKALESEADIYCINPEGLDWLLGDVARFNQLGADTLVVDESSKFKDTGTKRFKALKPFLPRFARRWILTGSPMPNGYEDLFGQMYILDLGHALGEYVTHYRNRYFFSTGFGGYTWKLKDEMTVDKRTYLPADDQTEPRQCSVTSAEKAIQQRIKPLALRFEAEDYLKMPERFPIVHRVYLPDDVQKQYEQMEDELLTELTDGTSIAAKNAASASNKCSQIANGGLYFTKIQEKDETVALVRGWKPLHNVKTEVAESIVDEASGVPVLIGYEFLHDLERLKAAFPKASVLGSMTSDTKASQIIRGWNNLEIPVLLAHPGSMGHGLNLQRGGNQIVWYGIPWDFELYDQFIRRIMRQGSRFPNVFIHHIVAGNTVDEAKMRALNRKDKDQKGFMNSLKSYLAEKKSNKVLRK